MSIECQAKMAGADSCSCQMLLQMELDGALSPDDAARLDDLGEECGSLGSLRDEWLMFSNGLEQLKRGAPANFVARVSEAASSLPADVQETGSEVPRATGRRIGWRIAAVAAVVMLAASGAFLLGGSEVARGFGGMFAAILDSLATFAITGAGLLGATWSSASFTLREWAAAEPLAFVAGVVAMLGLNLMIWRSLKRRSPAAVEERDSAGR